MRHNRDVPLSSLDNVEFKISKIKRNEKVKAMASLQNEDTR